MDIIKRVTQIKMSGYYLFVFFGFGVLFPMMGIYFDELGLTGSQIGMIMSVGPIVAIIAQPFWGMVVDRYQNPRTILTITTLLTGVTALGFLISESYFLFLLMAALLSLFQSAIVPISDSMTLSYVKREGIEYGSIRLWGALGFAFAVWISGMVVEVTVASSIFYLFALALLISTWFAKQMPENAESFKVDLRSGLARLIKIPPYLIFLVSTFLIFGPINANNFYFGIYYTSLGGTVAGFGLVFLFAAGSEAPFMKMAGFFIRRYGIIVILVVASILSASRWYFFYLEPSTTWILIVSIVQGISVGFYIPAAVQIVRDLTPDDVKVTGMSIYASIGNGLGTMACTFIGGYIYEYYSIAHTYLFFSIATWIGVLLLGWIALWKKKNEGIAT
jgi:PPP family 3-phenylpropionic acid transporter